MDDHCSFYEDGGWMLVLHHDQHRDGVECTTQRYIYRAFRFTDLRLIREVLGQRYIIKRGILMS